MEISRTVPIYKSGPPSDLTNYRPLSCLPILSKIIEKMVSKQMNEYLNIHNLLNKHQYGFQTNKSTVHALLHIVGFISKALNNNELVVAVFLDLGKAFDLVDHNIPILKLEKYGIRGAALNCFRSYLKDNFTSGMSRFFIRF